MRIAGQWLMGLLVAGAMGSAWGAGGSGHLLVKVQDLAGRPLSGATIEVEVPPAATAPSPARTDARGTAGFELPLQGPYVVRATLAGFTASSSGQITLRAGFVRTVQFVMRRQVAERVQVLASLEDPGENRTILPSDALDDLPILGRSYQNALSLAPGVTDLNHDGNPNVNGARERDFRSTVDGLANVDPLTGLYQSEVNPDAIAEVEVLTSGASAEYGGAVGGFGKVLTKEGTNSLNAMVGLYWRSAGLDRVGSSREIPSYRDVRPTLALTGPFLKGRLYYALFHELIDKGQPVDLPPGFARGLMDGVPFVVTTGGSYVIESHGTRSLDKVTWQLSNRQKLNLQFQSDPVETSPLGVGETADIPSGYELDQGGASYQAQWTFQGSSAFYAQTTIGVNRTSVSYRPLTRSIKNLCPLDFWGRQRLDVYGHEGGPLIDEDYCTGGRIWSGSYFRDYSDRRKRTTLKSDMSYYVDHLLGASHTFRMGVIAERRQYDAQQTLRSISHWTAFPYSVISGGGNGVIHREVFVNGNPYPQFNSAKGSNYGFYLEDQFSIHRLSVRVGARVDQENLVSEGFEPFDPSHEGTVYRKSFTRCLRNGAGIPGNTDRCARGGWPSFHKYELFPAAGNSAVRGILDTFGVKPRVPERFRISNTNLAPRLSLTYDPSSSGRSKFFATAGRYYGETFLAVPSFEQGPDSFMYTYDVHGSEVDCQPVPEAPGSFTCKWLSYIDGDRQANVALASIRQVDRELRTPYQDEYTAGITHELLPEVFASLTFIRRDYKDQLQDVDLNHYVAAPAVGNAPARESVYNPFFNQVLRVGNYNESTYRAWQVELRRRLRRNWEVDVSYVHSRAQGNAEDYNQTLGNDPGLADDEFGFLDYDVRHVVKLHARTQVPRWNLRLAGAVTWLSGTPFSLTGTTFVNDIPQRFGNVLIGYGRNRTYYPTGVRNDQRNNGYYNVDLGLRKDFAVKRLDLTLSLDVFNALDDNTLLTQEAAEPTATLRAESSSIYRQGRQIQLGAKVVY